MIKSKKSILLFFIFTTIFSAIIYYFIIDKGRYLSPILMWCPGMAAITVKNIYYRNEKKFFWGSKNYKYNLLGISLPIFYLGISYIIFWIFKEGSFKISNFSYDIKSYVILAMVSVITAMGEEIGWRGFLVPRLKESYSFRNTAIVSGVIWSLWHFPLIISGNYIKGASLIYILISFTVEITAMGIIMAYLTLKAKGFWPAILFHASHNYFDQIIFDEITTSKLKVYLVSESGIITCTIVIVIAIIFYRKGIREL